MEGEVSCTNIKVGLKCFNWLTHVFYLFNFALLYEKVYSSMCMLGTSSETFKITITPFLAMNQAREGGFEGL